MSCKLLLSIRLQSLQVLVSNGGVRCVSGPGKSMSNGPPPPPHLTVEHPQSTVSANAGDWTTVRKGGGSGGVGVDPGPGHLILFYQKSVILRLCS